MHTQSHAVHSRLYVVLIAGSDPPEDDSELPLNLPGDFGWWRTDYVSKAEGASDPILGFDQERSGGFDWGFSVLISDSQRDPLERYLTDSEIYSLEGIKEVVEGGRFGSDETGVQICKHPGGWTVLELG